MMDTLYKCSTTFTLYSFRMRRVLSGNCSQIRRRRVEECAKPPWNPLPYVRCHDQIDKEFAEKMRLCRRHYFVDDSNVSNDGMLKPAKKVQSSIWERISRKFASYSHTPFSRGFHGNSVATPCVIKT